MLPSPSQEELPSVQNSREEAEQPSSPLRHLGAVVQPKGALHTPGCGVESDEAGAFFHFDTIRAALQSPHPRRALEPLYAALASADATGAPRTLHALKVLIDIPHAGGAWQEGIPLALASVWIGKRVQKPQAVLAAAERPELWRTPWLRNGVPVASWTASLLATWAVMESRAPSSSTSGRAWRRLATQQEEACRARGLTLSPSDASSPSSSPSVANVPSDIHHKLCDLATFLKAWGEPVLESRPAAERAALLAEACGLLAVHVPDTSAVLALEASCPEAAHAWSTSIGAGLSPIEAPSSGTKGRVLVQIEEKASLDEPLTLRTMTPADYLALRSLTRIMAMRERESVYYATTHTVQPSFLEALQAWGGPSWSSPPPTSLPHVWYGDFKEEEGLDTTFPGHQSLERKDLWFDVSRHPAVRVHDILGWHASWRATGAWTSVAQILDTLLPVPASPPTMLLLSHSKSVSLSLKGDEAPSLDSETTASPTPSARVRPLWKAVAELPYPQAEELAAAMLGHARQATHLAQTWWQPVQTDVTARSLMQLFMSATTLKKEGDRLPVLREIAEKAPLVQRAQGKGPLTFCVGKGPERWTMHGYLWARGTQPGADISRRLYEAGLPYPDVGWYTPEGVPVPFMAAVLRGLARLTQSYDTALFEYDPKKNYLARALRAHAPFFLKKALSPSSPQDQEILMDAIFETLPVTLIASALQVLRENQVPLRFRVEHCEILKQRARLPFPEDSFYQAEQEVMYEVHDHLLQGVLSPVMTQVALEAVMTKEDVPNAPALKRQRL